MHTRIRRVALLVLAVLQLEACFRTRPADDYGITITIHTEAGPYTVVTRE